MEQISEPAIRVWRVLSWVAALGFLGLGTWWMFYLPTVGKGGIVLAVGATLMPLFWEKTGVVGKNDVDRDVISLARRRVSRHRQRAQ